MRILLADDDEPMRVLLEAVLQVSGHEVEVHENGRSAWESYERNPAALMVLDWHMPELDGIELCRRVRAHPEGDRTYLLMITARAQPEDLEHVLDAGADDYLPKPVTAADVLARLRIALKRMESAARRRAAEDGLRRARYLAGVGEVALALQHEINNPLTALLSTSYLAANGMIPAAEMPESLRTIDVQAKRIAEVLKRLQALKEEKSVEYSHGQKMVDLRGEEPT
jgi:two-component system, NtrC family, sensor kinase